MDQENCVGAGSIILFVIGTFLTTIILIGVSAYFFRRWRRNKGRHLVLVTRPEIVEDAYAFDNPCFKDATPGYNKSMERPQSVSFVETPVKESPKWTSPWSLLASGANNKHDNRRTLDDSILVPTATRVSVVSLRSRDFTGLGFNVCGNMLEGIFVKDLLHRGPASESGRIHPGDRIASVKISFRNMAYEDALTILSYASPYDVEIEVESGGTGSRPTTLLKKTVGPSPTRICHPLYRSQSIPEFSHNQKTTAKRLFITDPNETINNTTINSTLKSTKSIKSTPDSHTLKKRHDEIQQLNHHKIGIKVLPSLDGTVHRIVDQNEHNTNLERRNSRKIDKISPTSAINDHEKITTEHHRQRENPFIKKIGNGIDNTDYHNNQILNNESKEIVIVSDVPAEVHNAAMAARRNRKSSLEYLDQTKDNIDTTTDFDDIKNSLKNKRKAPAPAPPDTPIKEKEKETENSIESIVDYKESLNDYTGKIIHDNKTTIDDVEKRRQRSDERLSDRRNSESDTDSEMQHSFTTIELNPADITIHHTPVPRPEIGDDDDDDDDDKNEDDIYRKAASLGDLSKYESKNTATLERAQSLDMADTSSKKRKAPLPPEDIIELTEDLTKLDDLDNRFDNRKLKKSNEWGTLEDALWETTKNVDTDLPIIMRKNSNITLERSKSAIEIKLDNDDTLNCDSTINNDKPLNNNNNDINNDNDDDDDDDDSSFELFNLPLSAKLSKEFIETEKMFNLNEDNALARIVNDGEIVKSKTPQDVELDFRKAKPKLSSDDEDEIGRKAEESYRRGLAFLDLNIKPFEKNKNEIEIDLTNEDDENIYAGMKEVIEEPIKKITISRICPGCENRGHHDKYCKLKTSENNNDSTKLPIIPDAEIFKIIEKQIEYSIINKNKNDDEDVDDGFDLGSTVTINKTKNISSKNGDNHNISNISVSSGENSEDSGLVGESGDFNQDIKPSLPKTPAPHIDTSEKLNYITEIKVSSTDNEDNSKILDKPLKNEVIVTSNGRRLSGKKPPVPPRRSDSTKSHFKGNSSDKQVVYVSEVKTPDKNQNESIEIPDKKSINKDFDNWIYKSDNKEQNPWGNGSSQSPQPVTNIVVTSGDQKQS